jgi:hypothetical protein
MVQMQISEAPTPIATFRPELPAWCSAILERALAKSPADRFQSAEEFRAALSAAVTPQALGDMPTLATPTPPGLPLDLDMTLPHGTPSPIRASAVIPSAQVRPATSGSPAIRTAASSHPTPARTPPVEKATTVVLGRTRLMAIGTLFVIVATGIALLALAAFRGARPAQAPIAASIAAPESTPAPEVAAAADNTTGAADAPPASTVVPPAATPPVPEAAPAPGTASVPAPPKATPTAGADQGSQPAGGERGVATAGAGPAAAKTVGRGPASGVSSRGTPAPGRGAGSNEAVAAPVPAAPPVLPAPVEPPLTFNEVRLLVAEGDRVREREGMLQLGDGRVSIVTAGGGAPIMSLSTDALTGIFYARSKQPRWRDASGQTVESKIDLGRLGFLRSDRNWVILLNSGEPVIFRIEDSAMRTILPALQERTGQKIQR